MSAHLLVGHNEAFPSSAFHNSHPQWSVQPIEAHYHQPQFSSLPSPSSTKLPSLEGLLKRIHHDAGSPTSPFEAARMAEHHSPISRNMTPMPSLRAIISPSLTKNGLSSSQMMSMDHSLSPIQYGVPQTPIYEAMVGSPSYPYMATEGSMPSRKRSWDNSSHFQATKYYTEMPERNVSPRFTTTHVHRTRASKYCKIEGCERVSQRNNLCHSHGGKRLCKEDGCSSKDRGNGYCIKHGGGKICSMSGCEKKARRKGLCTQHFRVSDEYTESGYEPSAL